MQPTNERLFSPLGFPVAWEHFIISGSCPSPQPEGTHANELRLNPGSSSRLSEVVKKKKKKKKNLDSGLGEGFSE